MKKKLLSTLIASICAFTCVFGLSACNLFGQGDDATDSGMNVTATVCEVKEIPHVLTISGWGLTDTEESQDKVERYCIDLYVYVAVTAQYESVTIKKEDFTVDGKSPDSCNEVGKNYILDTGNFEEFMSDQKPYMSSVSSQETGDKDTGYTVKSGAEYRPIRETSLSRYQHFIQRYVLEFDTPVVAAQIKWNGDTVKKYDEQDSFPNNTYSMMSRAAVQAFVYDNTAYKVTYGQTTYYYTTPVNDTYNASDFVLELKEVNFNNVFKDYTVKAERFSIEIDGQKYQATQFYKGVFENDKGVVTEYQDGILQNIDAYKNVDLKYIHAERDRWSYETSTPCNQLSGSNDFSLCFDELKSKPTSYKVYFDNTAITVA